MTRWTLTGSRLNDGSGGTLNVALSFLCELMLENDQVTLFTVQDLHAVGGDRISGVAVNAQGTVTHNFALETQASVELMNTQSHIYRGLALVWVDPPVRDAECKLVDAILFRPSADCQFIYLSAPSETYYLASGGKS